MLPLSLFLLGEDLLVADVEVGIGRFEGRARSFEGFSAAFGSVIVWRSLCGSRGSGEDESEV
jgi:hypothetical protein